MIVVERYLSLYNELMIKYQNIDIEGYTEKHHILPKCLGGTNKKHNLVRLSAKAHYVAHHLLYKAFPNNRKLANAFGMMLKGKNKRQFSARMYDQARKALSIAQTGRKRPDVSERNGKQKGIPTGKPMPAHVKAALIEANKNRIILPMSDETKEKHRINGKRLGLFDVYNNKKKIEGFTEKEIENKRKAGRARKGVVMSEEGKLSYSKAAIKRYQNAPIVECIKCGHKQKRSPNFYKYHNSNCNL